ncbi:acetolactate synthase large subunit [Cognatishimia sp. WU-CL00825]|uniref:thiamine pyrophosphate-binding protein n=1 Tax=Cognatishimia sp. WU-CL00825 TaxID=3127658 RepID=UPI00310C4D24
MTKSTKPTGATIIADVIEKHEKVDTIFFVDAVLRYTLLQLEERGIKRILAHSEKAAAYMADGYARVSGKTGVCMAQAVGAANLAAGLQDGYLDRVSMLALTGRKADTHLDRNAYQEVAHGPMYSSVTNYTAQVRTVEELPRMLGNALRATRTNTPRPAHLDLDGLKGDKVEEATFEGNAALLDFPASGISKPGLPHVDALNEAAELIKNAKKPMLVAGVSSLYSKAGAGLKALAEAAGIPVATSVGGRSVIETSHPNHFGIVGTYSAPYANELLAEADLVIYVGCHMGDQISCDWTIPALGTNIIQIDTDAAELGRGYPNVLGLCGDLNDTCQALSGISGEATSDDWLTKCTSAAQTWLETSMAGIRTETGLIPAPRLAYEVGEALPDNGVVVADTGFSATWTAQYTAFDKPGQTYLRAAGSLGWAFPAALGAALGAPDRPVVCFTGDGALYYHIGELETMRRWNIPMVLVVNNNSALGQGLRSVKKLYSERDGNLGDLVEFQKNNFADMAKTYGIKSFRVEKVEDIRPTIEQAIALREPVVVDVVTDPDSNPEPAWLV